eukprot:3323022-Amphidinium_carterae.1
MAATRPSKEREPYLKVISVQVNYMEELTYMPLHYDAKNDTACSSWVISGAPREHWRTPADASKLGYMYDTYQTWVKLPARYVLHGVTQ